MKIVACGVGGTGRGDDAFGPYVVQHLRESTSVKIINCGLYPENYLNKIIALVPDLVIFFDAIAKEDKAPVIMKNEEIAEQCPVSVTTHSLSFGAVYEFLRESGVENVLFIGVPAESYVEHSKNMEMIAERIISVLNNIDRAQGFNIINLYEALSEQIR
jgi:hydrogenase maturation protease